MEDVAALREQVDVIVVLPQWGVEYTNNPTQTQRSRAGVAVKAGADLVIGNHPHWVQSVEVYEGGYITYAHGNYIFDQDWSYETTVGVIGKYTFYDDQLIGVEFIPTRIENSAQPVPMVGEERQAVLDGMRDASQQLADLLAGG